MASDSAAEVASEFFADRPRSTVPVVGSFVVHSTLAEPSGRGVTTGAVEVGFLVSAAGVTKVAGASVNAGEVRATPFASREVTR